MTRTTRRRARKQHRCGMVGMKSFCRIIEPGEIYLEHVISPDHDDVGNVGWWRAAECSDCAIQCKRGHLLEGPTDDPH